MKKRWIIGIAALLVVVIAVWIFWPKDQSSHARVIPADATALASFNAEDFIKESGLTDEKMGKLFSGDKELYRSALDLQKNVYAFVSADGMIGFLFPVKDADKLKECLAKSQGLDVSPVEEQQGYNWAFAGNSFELGFDDDVLLVMGPTIASAQAELRQQMLGYLKQDKSESVVETSLYKNLEKQEGILKMVASLEAFPEYYKVFQNMGLPDHVDFSKMLMTASMESAAGKIIFHTGLSTEDKALSQKMKALDDLSRQIHGDFIPYAAPNTLVWLGTNVKGDKLMTLMSEMPSLRLYLMAMNNVMDVERMLKTINGDLAFTVTMEKTPVVSMQAHMENLSFMDDADYWISAARNSGSYRFERVGEDLYCMSTPAKKDLYLGLKDKDVILSTDRADMDRLQQGKKQNLLEPYEKDIKNSKFYLWANMGGLMGYYHLLDLSNGDNPALNRMFQALGKINAVALRSSNATSMDLIFYMKDKKSGLKQLFE